MSLLARAADALWDPWLLGFFLLTGLLLSLGCGFFPLFRVRLWLSATLGSLFRPRDRPVRGISSLQALSTALASTIGTGSIAGVAQRLVPAMALLYLGSGLAVLLLRREQLPHALALIFSSALSPSAALGGGAGYTLLTALRHGVARGVFTNEAGLGTSAMAHGAAQVDHPARQGMWGIFEVFCSTLVVCTVTALVILVSGAYDPEAALAQLQTGVVPDAAMGVPLTARAFSSVLGPAGTWAVSLSLILFAFSSILGWSCYGQQSLRFLTGGDRLLPTYRAVFLLCTVLGAVADVSPLWQLVDLCNALMAIPNLTALLLLSPQVLRELRDWERTGG